VLSRPLEEIEQEDEQERDDDPEGEIAKIVQRAVLSTGAKARFPGGQGTRRN
jgi:hypothetical protein